MAEKANVPYRPSPTGIAVHPWLNKPDTKYNADGAWKVGLLFEGETAAKFRELVDAGVDEAFAEAMDDVPATKRKDWRKHYPYEVELDDQGAPTGRIQFFFKQNAVIKVEGKPKEIKMPLFDARDKEAPGAQIYGGSKLRVMFRARSTGRIASAQKAGVTLSFLKVQIIQLADRSAQGGGFGSVEGGYEDEGEAASPLDNVQAADAPAEGADF